MSLESEILTDLRQLLSEHGVKARWKSIDLLVLVSRVKREQPIDMGGFVDSPDLSLRVPKLAFPGPLPKFGERIEVDGTEYRISQVSIHPRSPLLTLTLLHPFDIAITTFFIAFTAFLAFLFRRCCCNQDCKASAGTSGAMMNGGKWRIGVGENGFTGWFQGSRLLHAAFSPRRKASR